MAAATLLYDSFLDDTFNAAIGPSADTFKIELLTSSYTPNKGTHTKRSDLTNEVAGAGYSAGGTAITVTIAKDTSNHKSTLTWSNPSWAASTITARYGVIYKSRGGASSADNLVCYFDFGSDFTSTAGTFTVTSGVITYQNP